MTYFNRSLFLIFCLICSISYSQQISVDNSVSPQDLIQNTLVQGCVEVSNISSPLNGSTLGIGSYGYFERGASNFPFENGIVLTTGDASSAGNGINTNVLNAGDDTWLTDSDLETALGISGTLNATSIEFDFISISNQIQFNYILASEEYFGNNPCNYSDGFAFLIREAGTTNPYTNIALVPGTTTPVNTNTVHAEIVGFCPASNDEYFEGYNIGDTNYNGRTTVLTATASIQPNVQYQIKLVIADQNDENFDSAVFIEGNSFDASVDLGEDFTTCATSSTLDADIGNPNAVYSWYLNGVLMPSETQATLNAIQSGNYNVKVQIPLAGSSCYIEDDINITLNSPQTSDPISDYEVCDDLGGDGVETFDLSTKNAEVLNTVPPSTYTISYHYTETDALNNNNAITSQIQNTSNPQTIHVRIEDNVNGCLAYSTFNLVVHTPPIIGNPSDVVICADASANGIASMDLNSLRDSQIVLGQNDLIVTYHGTASDAANGVNAFPMPYSNTNPNEQLFVSIRDVDTGCIRTTTININVFDSPTINAQGPHFIDACDSDLDGFASFDLTSIIPDVLEGLTGVSTTFHLTAEDALTGANPIADESNYSNINANVQTIYIRVEDDSSGCSSVAPIELHSNLLLTATNIRDVTACDIDDDGTEDFTFDSIATTIINNLEDVTVTFYETEDDRNNGTNPIDSSSPYPSQDNPQIIYITLESPTCTEFAEFELILFPIVEFDSVGTLEVCDDDQDGIVTTDLSHLNADVTNGQTGFNVKYYLTEQDAIDDTNALPNLYENVSNPFTLYTRISFSETGCFTNNSLEVKIIPAPESEKPDDIIICDDDRDGYSSVNLYQSIPTSILATSNRTVTFHNSLSDAQNDENPILSMYNYEATTEIVYMRVENSNTNCYVIEELSITVNALPFVGDLTNYVDEYNFCEDVSDGIGEFIFQTKDEEALSGQVGNEVSYYLTALDAENKTNPIDKTSVYENISNPQEIYVRVENISDESCYMTSSFQIEVGTNPTYNEPTDIFVCDDISNDGSVLLDLTSIVDEVSAGIPDIQSVKFFTTELDAKNNTNEIPLQYANTVNPQQIYVQIDNGTICQSITSFVVNVIKVPDMTPVAPMIVCEEDMDGTSVFDLTTAEDHITDVRQENIVINYYETLEDAESNTNEIAVPQSYTNLTNPQTVYIKVTNTLSNCPALVPFELVVNQPPVINDFQTYNVCSNPDNTVDLSQINQIATDVNFNVLFSYFSNEADAIANTNALDTNYEYQSTSEILYVRAEYSTTHCFDYYEFNLIVDPLPVANQPSDLVACDDNHDGILEFDLTSQNASILGGQSPTLYSISYHNSELEAHEDIMPLDTDYVAFDGEVIYARIENNTTGCYSLTQFSIIINPIPFVDIGDQVVCIDNLPLLVSANTNVSTDTYLWSTGETSPEIEITEVGSYWVTVTSDLGCENTSSFNVTESEAATIETTEVVDFSDPNNITVTISGIGNYMYQLDNFPPQESNVFENVAMGYHTITIIDLNGCSNITKEVLVIDIPKFFTPNDDGAFDTWHIVGVETLPGTVIDIFNRYGKFLTQIRSDTPGWDGTFNGLKLPASDYWYVANVKRGEIAFQLKGHFTLRR